jgi:hypothetical protein
MVYIDRYIPIYKFKYVYLHIRVRQQLEYTLKSKNKKKCGRRCWRAPIKSRFVIPPGTKGSFSPGWFNRN